MSDERFDTDKLARIPIWHGDKSKDSLSAEHWIRRVDLLQKSQGWSNLQAASYAYLAFRSQAVVFNDYLRKQKINVDDWPVVRKEFLRYFGTQRQDNTRVTNLALRQKVGEGCHYFGFRVSATVEEFESSIKHRAPTSDDPRLGEVPAEWTTLLQGIADVPAFIRLVSAHTFRIATGYYNEGIEHYGDHLARTVFLNGLLPNIQALAKLQPAATLKDAVEATINVELAQNGPANKVSSEVTALHPDGDEAENDLMEDPEVVAAIQKHPELVSAMQRHFRKRRGGRTNTWSRPAYAQPYSGGSTRSLECWYCHKKSHMQKNCKTRIARGAAMVPRPRSVQEVAVDRMVHQELPDEEEELAKESEEFPDDQEAINTLSLNY